MGNETRLSWQLGQVKISRILETVLPVAYHEKYPFIAEARPAALRDIPWLYPDFVSPEDELRLSIHALLVQTRQFNLLVDTCIGNDKPRALTGNEALHSAFLEDLAAAGCPRESVDYVICTHLHVDHVGWNTMKTGAGWQATFPNARYLLGREEYEYWCASDAEDQQAVMADSVAPIFEAGLVDLVESDHRLADEVSLLPTAGHTPGHVSVLIESAGQRALITGDTMHHPCQIAHPNWSVRFDEDKKQAAACRRRLIDELADQPVLVIGTHFATPTAGRIVTDEQGYRFLC